MSMSAVAEIVRAVSQRIELAHDDVGRIVGVSGRTVATWLRDSTPHQQARQRLLELSIVAEQLDQTLKLAPADAKAWILSPNELLHGETPADRIASGRLQDVLPLIEALADGIVA
jgi:hypothetical protein